MMQKLATKKIDTHANTIENATVLSNELAWLQEILNTRVALYFKHETIYKTIHDIPTPDLTAYETPYSKFIKNNELSTQERILLILALVPHIQPALLDILSTKNKEYNLRFSEFGGIYLEEHTGCIATAETALFLLTGDNLKERLIQQQLVTSTGKLVSKGIIAKEQKQTAKPLLSTSWIIAPEYIDYLLYGKPYEIAYSTDFPAQQISATLNWEDLIVSKSTAAGLQEIRDWIIYGNIVLQELDLGKRLKPGYKTLFHGAPGTGKSMAAALIGKSTGKHVYKIDLSMTISKYIGETEKNLAKVFDQAQHHDWILFFDEADSLFGKRTQVNSANDRYGNQEIGYLLQRIEDFPGVVILASNLKDNIDEAFTRRFQSMIEFKMPGVEERHTLWKRSFSDKLPLDEMIDVWKIAENYELSGGLMMNVVRKCTLEAVAKQQTTITQKRLEAAIRSELQKEGFLLN